ncbi:MAG: hypothetical protein A3F83_11020 [Candidatus Glassbacteria bacterium RIFCSPLOWO2_12_FULL_58_11]|uniref:Zinc-ribbon domain-containing protein n=2 Tax=Candidatus Glassiibacteriota TaxID=1817805 RepID=A0A1F5YN11_9BACT|nr:MAG: hypothetical protein A2Z86_09295 [Candidatus Glassbacteria bacterium GWA2_58_10]OGG01579.1 MAG: hypothetical protein A3F83_11020 [Candidatus Glassbacteria bacterium RIFCSPLOWO2_12_FULL_58_11]
MRIRCPQCKRFFDFDPAAGPARCPHEGCGWSFAEQAAPDSLPVRQAEKPALEFSPASTILPARNRTGKPPSLAGERLPAERAKDDSGTFTATIRCPGCRTRIPDNLNFCPACGTDLADAFSKSQGIRAVFDVSGDITFTPKMVVFLIVVALASFLTFTWIISNRGKEEYTPLVISDPEIKEGGVNRPLQGVTFAELRQEFQDPKNTDLRKDVLLHKFVGQRVIWPGIVKSVTADNNAYRLDLIMEGLNSRSFVTLQALKLPNNEKMVANLVRGQNILFSGKITGFDTGGPAETFDYFRIQLGEGIILK